MPSSPSVTTSIPARTCSSTTSATAVVTQLGEAVGVVGPAVLALPHDLEQVVRAGEAADVGREDAIGAPLHGPGTLGATAHERQARVRPRRTYGGRRDRAGRRGGVPRRSGRGAAHPVPRGRRRGRRRAVRGPDERLSRCRGAVRRQGVPGARCPARPRHRRERVRRRGPRGGPAVPRGRGVAACAVVREPPALGPPTWPRRTPPGCGGSSPTAPRTSPTWPRTPPGRVCWSACWCPTPGRRRPASASSGPRLRRRCACCAASPRPGWTPRA